MYISAYLEFKVLINPVKNKVLRLFLRLYTALAQNANNNEPTLTH